MSLPEFEELTSSRGKAAIGLIGCLAFVAISLFAEQSGDTSWKLQAGGIFFGLCALTFVAMLIRPHRLRLDPEGFTLSGGLTRTPRKIGWRHVGEFYVRPLSHGASMVAFKYADEAVVPFGGVLGKSGGIPGVWPDGPDALAYMLNDYRDAALSHR
ncbi:hypothetical protein GRI89_00145 [Altererythrobacter salegens]|uniref:PH domain-containing protein n=1 Tax=Croceibacterium salegens TaxID=1737568 RepID=A0A6I4SRB5_9SPHN|nr:hypothetical protein [Croceibacterium salegens]MXO57958.1 hypothetical protein [Croceibacterium salegens]